METMHRQTAKGFTPSPSTWVVILEKLLNLLRLSVSHLKCAESESKYNDLASTDV